MYHFTNFLLVLAIALGAVSLALTLWFRIKYKHQSTIWFASTLIGLIGFLFEILIHRYGTVVKPIVDSYTYETIVSVSNFWGLIGGVAITISLPRLARIVSGLQKNLVWYLFENVIPIVTAVSAILFLLSIKNNITSLILQITVFGTVIVSFLIILIFSRNSQKKKELRLYRRVFILGAIIQPFIIIDAMRLNLPSVFEDLSMIIFVIGISVLTILEVDNMFGKPTFLNGVEISSYFIEKFMITPREKEIIIEVLKGHSNLKISDELSISEKTVENHLSSILKKTEQKNRIELFRLIHSSKSISD